MQASVTVCLPVHPALPHGAPWEIARNVKIICYNQHAFGLACVCYNLLHVHLGHMLYGHSFLPKGRYGIQLYGTPCPRYELLFGSNQQRVLNVRLNRAQSLACVCCNLLHVHLGHGIHCQVTTRILWHSLV